MIILIKFLWSFIVRGIIVILFLVCDFISLLILFWFNNSFLVFVFLWLKIEDVLNFVMCMFKIKIFLFLNVI